MTQVAPAPAPPAAPSAPVAPVAPVATPASAEPAATGVTFSGWTQTRAAASRTDDPVAVIVGKLLFSKFQLDCNGAQASKVLKAITDATGVNCAVRYDSIFDGQTAVTLSLKDATAKQAIEAVIGQMGGDATWQITDGIVEIGRRSYLARSNARVTRVYPIGDLTLEAPYFKSFMDPDGAVTKRRTPMEVAGEFMFQIYTQLEPAAWQPEPPAEAPAGNPGGTTGPATAPARPAGDTTKPANFDPNAGPLFVRGCWAQMNHRQHGGLLIVTAPDFVHRAINGYPKPLPPVAAQ